MLKCFVIRDKMLNPLADGPHDVQMAGVFLTKSRYFLSEYHKQEQWHRQQLSGK